MAVERVTANSRKRRPTIPPIISSGIKTAISEMLMVKTVKPISSAPFSAAANGAMPSSRWRVIFSMTTIASSTTNPVEMVRAIKREVVEAVSAQVHHGKGADQRNRHRDSGNERGAAVAQEDKDHHDDETTEISSVRSTSSTEARMVVVRSRTMVISMPSGIDALIEGICARNALHRCDDVGAGLAEDDDRNRALAIQIAARPDVLHGVGDLGDV